MTKQELQKEIQDKVKPGVKPSDIKRLKRSKSDSDIANIPPPPPLPPNHLLSDQLKEKQREIEELRTKLETAHQALKEIKQVLDDSLEARTAALKDWGEQREQIKLLSKELDETIDQASTEINKGDSEISQLRTKVWTLKTAKESLERELKLARINRPHLPSTLTNSTDNLDYLPYTFYIFLALWLVIWLTNPPHYKNHG